MRNKLFIMNEDDLPPSYADMFPLYDELPLGRRGESSVATAPPLNNNFYNPLSSGSLSSQSERSPSASSVTVPFDREGENNDTRRERRSREIRSMFSSLDTRSDEINSSINLVEGMHEMIEIKQQFSLLELEDQKVALIKRIEEIFVENEVTLLSACENEIEHATKKFEIVKSIIDSYTRVSSGVTRNVNALQLGNLEMYHNVMTKITQDICNHFSGESPGNVTDRIIYSKREVEDLEVILQTACGTVQTLPESQSNPDNDCSRLSNFDDLLTDIMTLVEEPLEFKKLFQIRHCFNTKLESETDMCFPLSIDSLDGHILVADKNNHCVKVFSQDGALQHNYAQTNTFKAPSYIAVDNIRKCIYVSDVALKKVIVFDLNGTLLTEYNAFMAPRGIAFTNNCLYVADAQDNKIKVFDVNSQTLVMNIESELKKPFYVAANEHGDIVVSDKSTKTVKFFDKFGRLIVDKSHLKNPHGLVFKSDKELYVTDYSKNIVSMYDIPPDEENIILIDNGLEFPIDLCFLSYDSMAISEFINGTIKIFDTSS